METSIGITGKDFVLIASDRSEGRSVILTKSDADKQRVIGDSLVLSLSGDPGDVIKFGEYVERSLRLEAIRHDRDMRPAQAAAWMRSTIARSLRSQHAKQVLPLLAGYDHPTDTPHLYWFDLYGALVPLPFAAQGYAAYIILSTLDRLHRPDITLDEGKALMKLCIEETCRRVGVVRPEFTVRAITKDGVQLLDLGLQMPKPFVHEPQSTVSSGAVVADTVMASA